MYIRFRQHSPNPFRKTLLTSTSFRLFGHFSRCSQQFLPQLLSPTSVCIPTSSPTSHMCPTPLFISGCIAFSTPVSFISSPTTSESVWVLFSTIGDGLAGKSDDQNPINLVPVRIKLAGRKSRQPISHQTCTDIATVRSAFLLGLVDAVRVVHLPLALSLLPHEEIVLLRVASSQAER